MIFLTRGERTILLGLSLCAIVGIGLNAYRAAHDRVTVTVMRREEPTAWDAALEASRRVALNAATASELERLPGIGPTLAARIIAYRQTHGPFQSLDELHNVQGIGPVTLSRIRPYVEL